MNDYLLDSTAWSIGGLMVGYLLGRIQGDVADIKRILHNRKDRP